MLCSQEVNRGPRDRDRLVSSTVAGYLYLEFEPTPYLDLLFHLQSSTCRLRRRIRFVAASHCCSLKLPLTHIMPTCSGCQNRLVVHNLVQKFGQYGQLCQSIGPANACKLARWIFSYFAIDCSWRSVYKVLAHDAQVGQTQAQHIVYRQVLSVDPYETILLPITVLQTIQPILRVLRSHLVTFAYSCCSLNPNL